MKTEWYDRTIQALQLNGKGKRTQQAYARSVRILTQFYAQSPDQITEQELQEYFLHRKNVDHGSPNTMSRLGGAIAESASSTDTSSNATGTSSESSEPKMSDAPCCSRNHYVGQTYSGGKFERNPTDEGEKREHDHSSSQAKQS